MNIERKKLKVEIFNEQYSLVSDESEVDVIRASSKVDKLMREIAEKSGLQDEKKIAVLAALRIASELISLDNRLVNCDKKHLELLGLIEKTDYSSTI